MMAVKSGILESKILFRSPVEAIMAGDDDIAPLIDDEDLECRARLKSA